MERSGLPDEGFDAAAAGIILGMAGARVLWVFEHLAEERGIDLRLSRGGMSWFGGFAGGVVAGLLVVELDRPLKLTVLVAAPPTLVVGHTTGKI